MTPKLSPKAIWYTGEEWHIGKSIGKGKFKIYGDSHSDCPQQVPRDMWYLHDGSSIDISVHCTRQKMEYKSSCITKNETCGFPFEYKGVNHSFCINKVEDKNGDYLWCPTISDSNVYFISYLRCGEECSTHIKNCATEKPENNQVYGCPLQGKI